MKLLSLLSVCLFVTLTQTVAQSDSVSAPGSSFNTSHGRYFWMGRNYRQEWNTPLKVPVINLATEHGGLTPVKRGGGKQTKSLRLEDPQGKQYTLRSIAKFITSKTLPGDLQSEAAADLVSDGVSASYPYAALSIPALAEAAGIPHGIAKVVYIPDDPRLGEYRKDFANMMALYEDRLPESVEKGYTTDEIVEKLEKDNDNDIDQLALLKIRILDMYVMDLDRHEDQWTWGATDNGNGKMFFPIAKDRDQAFYINQGLLPRFISGQSLVPQLEGFKAKSKDINRFNFASRNLDRFFLNELSEQDWKQTVDKFISQMTDEVIEKALAQQPAEIKDISAGKIINVLKQRRNYLAAEVMKYYHFLSKIVSVTSSDKKELFDITRNDDGSVQVQVFKMTKEGEQSVKMYDRKFDPAYTKEIRLYGFDGDDKFLVHGNTDKMKIRMIGGGGEDIFENTAKSSKGGIVYDKANGNNKITGPFKNKMSNDSTVNSFQRIYYKYNETTPFISATYNPDDGLFLGASLTTTRQGFRRTPYKTLNKISANRAFATGAFNFKYRNEFIGAFGPKTDFLTDIEIRAPRNVTNFFGYGVNSIFLKSKKVDYYRTRYNLGEISFLIRQRFSNKVTMTIGPTLEYYDLNKEDNLKKNIFLTPPPGLNMSTLYRHQLYAGGKFSLLIDTRNNKVMPEKGIVWQNTVRSLAGLNDSSFNLTQLNSDFSFYVSLIPGWLVFANRVGGGINLGEGFEFYNAQYLGNDDNLRGYRKNRFAGKSKLYNQAELRLKLGNFKTYLFPGSLGLFAFFDAGRVWVKNDTDKKTLTGYGGGFWFSPLRRILISIGYAVSKEDKLPVVGFGWQF